MLTQVWHLTIGFTASSVAHHALKSFHLYVQKHVVTVSINVIYMTTRQHFIIYANRTKKEYGIQIMKHAAFTEKIKLSQTGDLSNSRPYWYSDNMLEKSNILFSYENNKLSLEMDQSL